MHLSLCLHKWPVFYIFTVSSCTTGQLDKLLEIWTKCAKCALFESNNDIALNKNVMFCLLCFPQVVQKQVPEAGT